MRLTSRRAALALLAVTLSATAARAVITKLTPLAEVLESDQFIFVAKVDKLDPDNKDRPTATFTLSKKLKGEPPFDRIPVNMTGDDEAKKAGDTKTVFERLDASRELVFFVRKQGKLYNAKVFVEGSWFSLYGTPDADGKTVRWAFLHGEPFLRRTFKGSSAEMVKTVGDALAKKARPPEPDEKEKPGYGPAVTKPKNCDGGDPASGGREPPVLSYEDRGQGAHAPRSPALLGVIPSFVLVGPLAIVAALFPGVFARMAVGMKRWRAFLVVASANSTLALVYWVVYTYRLHWLAVSPLLSPRAFTAYLTLISLAGLVWAGRRYRTMAAAEPDITTAPGRTELLSLVGLTAFAAACTLLTAYFADWNSTVELPIREFTFIGVALATATAYAAYRAVTKAADGELPAVRLSLSGESVALAVLLLCGFSTVLLMGARTTAQVAGETQTGDAEVAFGPRLTGEPVALEVFAVEDGKREPLFGRVMSNLAIDGDRLYFGADIGGKAGAIMAANRHSGKLDWQFAYEGDPPKFLKEVFCTPTVANGKVYCGEGLHEDKDCRLFGVNAADGTPAWKTPFKTASHTEGAPAVADGKVFFPAGDDGVYCVKADTGEKLWQFAGGKEKGIHVDAAPAVQGGLVFVGSGLYSYVAIALDANTGEERWRTDLKLRAFGAPTVSGSKVFYAVGTGNIGADTWHYTEEDREKETDAAGAVVCLDAATGKEEWRFPLPRSCHTGVSVDAFSVYAGCRDGHVYALDRRTGKLRWKANIGSGLPLTSSPTVAASGGFPVAVYAVSSVGLVVCLNPQTGAVVWQKPLPGFFWDGRPENGVMCAPAVVTTPTPTGSRRTIYVGAMTVDPANVARKTVAVFKFEDAIGE